MLAVEWGSGRRQGKLSNIHLGARDPATGGYVMLGKTFKGMTDAMLEWQTARFQELAVGGTDGYVVRLRPEQVVEVAFDGVQASSRYPGGLALRFARVLRYRDDKGPGGGRHHRHRAGHARGLSCQRPNSALSPMTGGAVAAPPQPTPDTDNRHLSYLHTDADLPPVAIIDRSPIGTRHKIFFGLIAVVGAVAWTIIAFVRGETVNAVWFVVAAICTYVIGYRFYARLIEAKIVRPRDDHATPAEVFDDGSDYVPTDRRVLFGHHFAAIAGAGPLVGPVLATQMGYLPCSVWIIVGAVFAGAVQDYLVLWISTRRRGRSLGQMARDELGALGGAAALVGAFVIMVIIIAVLALVVVRGLAESPWGVFSIAMTIPIAVFMGCYLRFLRPGRVTEVSAIGFVLLMLAVASGHFVGQTAWGASWLNLSPVTVSWLIVGYGFVASVLPVWLLLAPRDYLSTFMKVGAIALLAIGICIAHPVMHAPAISGFAAHGGGPVFSGSLFPFLFITIACGALSGFHALISSGTTPKLLEKESQMRLIGYGGMLTESFVAVMALISASILDQHLYFALNAPTARTGGTAATAADYVNHLGLSGPPATSAATR